MIYRKYEFQDEQQAREMLGNAVQVHLGHITLVQATFTDEGEEITPPVMSDKWAVDALVTDPKPLESFEVWPSNPKHHISGWEQQYELDRK